MRKEIIALFSLSLLSALTLNAHAAPTNNHIVVAPTCLLKGFAAEYQTLASEQSLTLISVSDEGINQLILAKTKQTTACGGFMDVTADWQDAQKTKSAKSFLMNYAEPTVQQPKQYDIKYEKQVNQLIADINPSNIWANLTTLSNFENRYAKEENGKKAAEWIKAHVEKLAQDHNRKDVTVSYVDTPGYMQPSVVAKIGDSNEAGIVIGAHMDTFSFMGKRQPGADDDGSGTVTILEAARVVLSTDMRFKRPIYFIWYAAEEEGLIGSQYVVKDFVKNKTPVAAVAHFDMTGFTYQNDKTLWLLDDNVNADLTSFFDKLIQKYVKQPVGHTKCGYGCSDHASWTKAGFTAAAPFEAKFGQENKSIHSARDTMEKLSLDHMADFTKLATAFTVELAEPTA